MVDSPHESPQSMRDCLRVWLDALNREQGSRFELDGAGRCAFASGEGTPCVIEASDEFASLVLTAAVGELAPGREAELMRQALAWNHQGPGRLGAALALNSASGRLLLSQAWPVLAADLNGFALILGTFIDTADHLRAEFGGAALATLGAGDFMPPPSMLRA